MSEPQGTRLLAIRLDSVVLNPSTQIREKSINPEVVKNYREAMRQETQFPPITVVPVEPTDDSRGFILIDGWHRFRAMQELGIDHTDANVIIEADPNRYQWLAAQGNRTHGLSLTRKDKRRVFRAYVKAGEHRTGKIGKAKVKSARQMAKELQGIVSHRRLPDWMQQDFPSVYKLMSEPDATNDEPEQPFGKAQREKARAREIMIHAGEVKSAFYSLTNMELRSQIRQRYSFLQLERLERPESAVQKDYDNDEF